MCLDPLVGYLSGKYRWACPLHGETHHWEMCDNYEWPCKLRLHLRPQLPRQARKGRTIIPAIRQRNSFPSGSHRLEMGSHHPCLWRCPAWTPATSRTGKGGSSTRTMCTDPLSRMCVVSNVGLDKSHVLSSNNLRSVPTTKTSDS